MTTPEVVIDEIRKIRQQTKNNFLVVFQREHILVGPNDLNTTRFDHNFGPVELATIVASVTDLLTLAQRAELQIVTDKAVRAVKFTAGRCEAMWHPSK